MKYVVTFILLLCASVNCQSQVVHGNFVKMKGGLIGSLWYPSCTFGKVNDTFFFRLCLMSSDTNYSMPENSKLLIKFDNDSVMNLIRIGNLEKDHGWMQNIRYFTTVASYVCINDDIIDSKDFYKIIIGHKIKKIRVELNNGVRFDFEVPSKYQEKLKNRLIEEVDNILAKYSILNNNITSNLDENF